MSSQIPSSIGTDDSPSQELLRQQDKLSFNNEIQEIEQSIINSSQVPKIGKSIKVTKNDSIKNRITQITTELEQGNSVLVTSMSNSINKAISIIEIVKQKLAEKHENKIQITQFNKITSHSSTINPNYKYTENPKNQRMIANPLLQERLADNKDNNNHEILIHEREEQKIIKSIRGYKVYQLPVLHNLLVVGDGNQYDLTNWTIQRS
ncbi:hypothetical protein DFJ63DRAFT_87190 [Scheffersomyces coipomensis]|uniref:uncharacterized protein n=1 Tax=Scheffersomyces coipomensis TaxID=1788519 RepID=UPI00315CEDF9